MSDIQEYIKARNLAIASGAPACAALEIKHMSYSEVQTHCMRDKSGVKLSPKGVSYHDVNYMNEGKSKRARFKFENGTMAINGIKNYEEVFANTGPQATVAKPAGDAVSVSFNMPFSAKEQNNDMKAMVFLEGLNYLDLDSTQYVQFKIQANQMNCSNPKISGFVQRVYGFKTKEMIPGPNNVMVSAAGQPLPAPIIRGSMRFPLKYNPDSKVPFTEVYDARESAKFTDPNTGETKWQLAKYAGESINGKNYMNYITSASKVWMMDGVMNVNQSNFGPSISFDVWKIVIEHVPITRGEAKTTLSSDMQERLRKLAASEPVPVMVDNKGADDHEDGSPPTGAVIGQLTGAAAIMSNLPGQIITPANGAQSFNMSALSGALPTNGVQSFNMSALSSALPQMQMVTPVQPNGMPQMNMPAQSNGMPQMGMPVQPNGMPQMNMPAQFPQMNGQQMSQIGGIMPPMTGLPQAQPTLTPEQQYQMYLQQLAATMANGQPK